MVVVGGSVCGREQRKAVYGAASSTGQAMRGSEAVVFLRTVYSLATARHDFGDAVHVCVGVGVRKDDWVVIRVVGGDFER